MVLCCSTGSGLVSCAPQGSCLSPREPNAVARHSHLSNSPRLLLAFPFRDFGLIVTVAPPQSSSTVLAGSLHCIPPAGAYSTITTLPTASALPPHRKEIQRRFDAKTRARVYGLMREGLVDRLLWECSCVDAHHTAAYVLACGADKNYISSVCCFPSINDPPLERIMKERRQATPRNPPRSPVS